MKRSLLIVIAIVLVALTSACGKPKGDPAAVLEKYYQYVIDGNFEGAYELLSEDTHKRFPKDDFVLLQHLNRERTTLKNVKLNFAEEVKNAESDGLFYNYVTTFYVTEEITDLFEKKETTDNYKRSVVSDGEVWKVHRDGDAISFILDGILNIANAYIFGKGKDIDYIEAISYAKKGLSLDSENHALLYTLALAYYHAQRYDEALVELDTLANMSGYGDVLKSNALNVRGLTLQSTGKFDEAVDSFKEAVSLDENNEYAKTNLNRLNEFLKVFDN